MGRKGRGGRGGRMDGMRRVKITVAWTLVASLLLARMDGWCIPGLKEAAGDRFSLVC